MQPMDVLSTVVVLPIAWTAGPEFTQECYRIIQERREIYHGDGVMTSAGRLPCLEVYHVVEPMWDYFANKNDCLDILHQAFTSCLMASKDYSSIAIPTVSSGVCGVPSELVAQTMCEAVTKFCHCETHQPRLRVIHLVDINTVMVKLLQENFELQRARLRKTVRNLHGWPAYLVESLEWLAVYGKAWEMTWLAQPRNQSWVRVLFSLVHLNHTWKDLTRTGNTREAAAVLVTLITRKVMSSLQAGLYTWVEIPINWFQIHQSGEVQVRGRTGVVMM
ncbi:hypothetical protein LSAT2_008622 [Lamellibrachia satsuma]|nr:hypothetical protein LSAT2_008622 [Lamellibrachia satsuma]